MTARQIRILALVTDAYGGHGGISQYNRDLLGALASSDDVAQIVVLPRLGHVGSFDLPARITQHPPVFGRLRYTLHSIRTALEAGRYDVVLAGHVFHAPLAFVIARKSKAKIWLQLHGIDAWSRPGRLLRWVVEKSDLVTVVSRYTKRRFLNWANIEQDRVRVLPNTASERFAPGPKSQALLDDCGLRGKTVLLTVSRISRADWYKGHHRVIRVLPRLLRKYPDLAYAIAGEGDGRARLEDLVLEIGVAQSVVFLGRIHDDVLPDLYRSADIFIMPSTKEGFGIVFLEAMRSGIPVVGGNGDGSMDPLRDGRAGHAVDCDDEDELIKGIESAMQQEKGLQIHAGVFSQSSFFHHSQRLLEQILKSTRQCR